MTTLPDQASATSPTAAVEATAASQQAYVAMMDDEEGGGDAAAACNASIVAMHGSNSSNSSINNNNNNETPTATTTFREEVMDLIQELLHFNQRRSWKKKLLTVFMIVSTILVVIDLLFLGNIIRWIQQYGEWMSVHVFAGTLLFILLMIVCTLIMIPPSILTFVCGYVYTQVCGGVIQQSIPAAILASFAGCALGAVIAFVRARYMMRDLVKLFANRYKIIRAADRAIKHHGFRVMLLLRLCPIVPFNGLNYIGGITDVSMEDFCLSLVGILPLTALTAAVGATAEQLYVGLNQFDETTKAEQKARLSMIVAGLGFVLLAVCITIYFARKELDREIRAELEAENAKLAVGRNSNIIDNNNNNRISDEYYQQGMLDEVQVELQYADYEEGVDDEEWFWLYS